LGRAKSASNIRKLMEDAIGTQHNSYNCHVFTNELIDLKGDQANSTNKWMFITPSAEGHPQILLMGHYEDLLIREDGRWKFLMRTVYMDIPSESEAAK
jgi:hypothetical protein